MSYVERKMKVENELESISLRVDSLLEEINYLEKKKKEADELQGQMVDLHETILMLDEIYEEGRQSAEVSKEDIRSVIDELDSATVPDFNSARALLGLEEVGEESDEAEAA